MKKNILIVDNNDGFRKMLTMYIEEQDYGFKVYEANSGAAAVKSASKNKQDIVLLQMSLPQGSGMKTAKLIKKVSPRSKVIIMTMFNAEMFQKQFIGEHIDHVVGKSEFDSKLMHILKKCLRGL